MHNLFEYGDILNSPYEASALASLYGSIIYVRRIYRSDLRQRSLSPQSRRYDCTIT